MMNETNGIEVDIDNYYMKEYAKRGWDDVHFANDEDDDGPSSASQVMDENDDADQQDQHNHEGRCTTISTRKKRAAIVLAGIASFGAILGLGYGIGYGIGGSLDSSTNSNREAAVLSSNMNAVTLEDCISTYVPTYSPTTYSPSAAPPVVVSAASEEEQLVALFFPVFSNDIPIITDDDEVVTTTKTSEEEDEGDSNPNANGPVRTRRRLGSPLPTMTLEQPLMSREEVAEQQRKLACDRLLLRK